MPSRCIEGRGSGNGVRETGQGGEESWQQDGSRAGGAIPYNRSFPAREANPDGRQLPQLHRRRVGGRAERHGQSQSVGRHRCHRRIRAGRRCAGARRDSGSEGGFSGLGSRLDPGALEHPRSRRHGNSRAQGRAGASAVARGGQDAAGGHRRSDARRPDLQVLRRRGAASFGRTRAVGAPGRRRRGDARAGRRHRIDYAVEFSDRDSRVENCASACVRQLRRLQAG